MDYKKTYNDWLINLQKNGDDDSELINISNDEKQIEYRFGAELEFGTAGMRGIIGYGTNMMNIYTVRRATKGLAEYIKSLGTDAINKGVAISYDTRRFSDVFAKETAGVLVNNGIKVFIFKNPSPVPMLSFAVRHYNCIAGVMITASHNPKEYNGYKVYGKDGAQMSPEGTEKVVNYISKITDYFSVKNDKIEIVNSKYITLIDKDFDDLYVDTLCKLSLSPKAVEEYGKKLKIVYTPLHGSGARPMIKLLNKLGINFSVVESQLNADPNFSTVEVPNPENKEALQLGINLANEIKADVVFGTDPDSDRLGVAIRNKQGEFVGLTGNQVGVLLTNYILYRLKEDNVLPKNGVVIKSFVSTGMIKPICDYYGVQLVETPVGFKFIGEKIKEYEKDNSHTFLFGFEESCGYLRGTHARDKDAVVAGMLFAEMVCYYENNNTNIFDVLNSLYNKYGYVVDKTVSIKYEGLSAMAEMNSVVEKMRLKTINKVGNYNIVATRDYLNGIRTFQSGEKTTLDISNVNCVYYELEIGGFVCLRPSGTEPKLKLYYSVSGKDKADADSKLNELIEEFKKILNN